MTENERLNKLRHDLSNPLSAPAAEGQQKGVYQWLGGGEGGTQSIQVISQSGDDGVYEIVVKNGEISAKVNGESVPDDRILQDGDSVKLLNESGDVVATFHVGSGGFHGVYALPRTFVVQDLLQGQPAEGQVWWQGAQGVQGAQGGQTPPSVMVGVTMSDAPAEVLALGRRKDRAR